MSDTQTQQAHFLVSVEAMSADSLDTWIMRDGVQDALLYANKAGTLIPIGDETTVVGSIAVATPSSPADALLLMLGKNIANTPEARQAAERAVVALLREYPRERIVLLTEDDRALLIEGIALTRKSWESSGDSWIADVVANGYDGYTNSPDIVLLEAAFCENTILRHLGTDADRLGVLRILSRPEVIDIICSPDRAAPVCDYEEFCRAVAVAVSPMTGLVGRTALRQHRLEALQLHGLIVQRLAKRLGVKEEEDEEEGEAPAPA